MAYEIPQNLQYEEKIMFNLTFKQCIYIGLFGAIGGILFFRLPFAFEIRVLTGASIAIVGLGFAFLHLDTTIMNQWRYWTGLRQAGYFNSKMDALVGLTEITDEAIHLKDGSLVGAVSVQPFNFTLLSIEEKQAVLSEYKEFLHSLDFSVQLLIRTVDVDLTSYLTSLKKSVEKQQNPSLKQEFDSFANFVNGFVSERTIQNRLFYVVIRKEPNTAKNWLSLLSFRKKPKKSALMESLNHRVNLVMEKLQRCNLACHRLNDQELVGLLSSGFDSRSRIWGDYENPVTTVAK